MNQPDNQFSHFKGKDAISHVAEAQAEGIIDSAEVHGLETPGHLSAAADAGRDTAAVMLFVGALLYTFNQLSPGILAVFAVGWIFWKAGRSAWMGWFRLERLHRLLAQEKWEIDHHRQQERDELRVLYAAKGFEGKLLEDVLDVLMADGDRLLKVMVEEELGLHLQSYEHPLKQSLWAFVGATLAALISLMACFFFSWKGLLVGAIIQVGVFAAFSAKHARNGVIGAVIWNIGVLVFSFSSIYFFLATFYPHR